MKNDQHKVVTMPDGTQVIVCLSQIMDTQVKLRRLDSALTEIAASEEKDVEEVAELNAVDKDKLAELVGESVVLMV